MSRDTAEILKQALTLPAEAHAVLADSLLESLDEDVDPGAEAAWQAEIKRRVAQLESRSVPTIPWSEVRTRLVATLRHER